jgi:hypothetical protein
MPTYLRLPSQQQQVKQHTDREEEQVKIVKKDQDMDLILERGSRIIFILCTAAIVIVHIASLILKR